MTIHCRCHGKHRFVMQMMAYCQILVDVVTYMAYCSQISALLLCQIICHVISLGSLLSVSTDNQGFMYVEDAFLEIRITNFTIQREEVTVFCFETYFSNFCCRFAN